MVDLNELSRKLDEALANETEDSLNEWLNSGRAELTRWQRFWMWGAWADPDDFQARIYKLIEGYKSLIKRKTKT